MMRRNKADLVMQALQHGAEIRLGEATYVLKEGRLCLVTRRICWNSGATETELFDADISLNHFLFLTRMLTEEEVERLLCESFAHGPVERFH